MTSATKHVQRKPLEYMKQSKPKVTKRIKRHVRYSTHQVELDVIQVLTLPQVIVIGNSKQSYNLACSSKVSWLHQLGYTRSKCSQLRLESEETLHAECEAQHRA